MTDYLIATSKHYHLHFLFAKNVEVVANQMHVDIKVKVCSADTAASSLDTSQHLMLYDKRIVLIIDHLHL